MAAHQASPPSPDPLSLSFLLSFSACLGKLQVAEEAMPGACVRPSVRPCVRARQVHNSCGALRGGDLWPMAADEQSGQLF